MKHAVIRPGTLLSICLFICLLCSVSRVAAAAICDSDVPRLDLSSAASQVGELVTLVVSLEAKGAQVGATGNVLTFNTDELDVAAPPSPGQRTGDRNGTCSMSTQSANGETALTVGCFTLNPTYFQVPYEDGEVVLLTFQVLQCPPSGMIEIVNAATASDVSLPPGFIQGMCGIDGIITCDYSATTTTIPPTTTTTTQLTTTTLLTTTTTTLSPSTTTTVEPMTTTTMTVPPTTTTTLLTTTTTVEATTTTSTTTAPSTTTSTFSITTTTTAVPQTTTTTLSPTTTTSTSQPTTSTTVTTTNTSTTTVPEAKCGDGQVTAGEECDDGNRFDGDCCSSTCQIEGDGSPCTDDGNVCTNNECDGSGNCVAVENTATCDDGDSGSVVDQCQEGVCASALVALLETPCGEEQLPKKLRKFIAKNVKRAEKFLRKADNAADKAKGKKTAKFRNQATKQLDAILKKAAKAVKARKASQQISESCNAAIEGLVQDRRRVITAFVF